MAYTNSIPNAGDKFSLSQPQIQGNFVSIRTILDPDAGEVNFVPQGVEPTLPANNIGLFSMAATGVPIPAVASAPIQGPSELYINKVDSAGNAQYLPITAASIQNAPLGGQFMGFCYLPSGLIMKWGADTAPNLANFTTAYVTGNDVPVFNTVLNVQLTLRNLAAASATIYQLPTSTPLALHVFLTNPAAANVEFFYLAIGY